MTETSPAICVISLLISLASSNLIGKIVVVANTCYSCCIKASYGLHELSSLELCCGDEWEMNDRCVMRVEMMNGCVAVKKEPNPLLAIDAHLHPPITPYYLTTSVKP